MNNLLVALEITSLGMGLVFAAIVLLWWMMALLTGALKEKASAPDEAETVPVLENGLKARAAAIAVAVVLAEQHTAHAHALSTPPAAIVSAWQLGMRTRQLTEKGTPLVRNPRKVG
jgi:Na+-transporting methylmalonyl-CoA/oxaloacetate decarboxylase gamma subunit